MTLLDQIKQAEKELKFREDEVKRQKQVVADLMYKRLTCNHTFTKPIIGYEHEGGQCVHCGINEGGSMCNGLGRSYF